jgi:hypothetical protein
LIEWKLPKPSQKKSCFITVEESIEIRFNYGGEFLDRKSQMRRSLNTMRAIFGAGKIIFDRMKRSLNQVRIASSRMKRIITGMCETSRVKESQR